MIWEDNIETYIIMCKIESQWEFDVWHRELKAGALWQPEGWDFPGGSDGKASVYNVGD